MIANYMRFNVLKFSVIPNPSSGTVTIVMEKPFTDATVEVIDILGVVRQRYDFAEMKNSETLDLSPLASGIYEIRVMTPNSEGVAHIALKH